jgi:ribonuclease P protein subunit POP4
VPKAAATFEFEIPAEGGVRIVTVEGEKLEARPARRTEQTGDSKWR